MRTLGWILVIIALINLFIAKFPQALIVGLVGVLILVLNKDKTKVVEMPKIPIDSSSSPQNQNNKSLLYTEVLETKTVEKMIKANFSQWNSNDIAETMSSFRRWADNQNIPIANVKINFIRSFKETFGEKGDALFYEHVKQEQYVEAARFKIKPSNTCCHYMIKWLEEKGLTGDYSNTFEDTKEFNNKNNSGNIFSSIESEKSGVHEKNEIYENKYLSRCIRNFQDIIKENPGAKFELLKNDKGKPFFVLGDEVGYVNPSVQNYIQNMSDKGIDIKDYANRFQYSEDKKADLPDFDEDGISNWIPTLNFRLFKIPESCNFEETLIVERQANKDFSTLQLDDIEEIVASFKRLSEGMYCELKDVKLTFISNAKSLDIKDIEKEMNKLLPSILTEAAIYDCKASNTSGRYKALWLNELINHKIKDNN